MKSPPRTRTVRGPRPVAPTATQAGGTGSGTVSGTNGAGVNCRSDAGTQDGDHAVLPEGASVTYRGSAQNGWISATYLRTTPATTPTPTATPSPTVAPGATGIVTNTGGLGLNCRAGAGTAYAVITVLREGTRVPVRGAAQGGWVPVTCGGRAGWVSASYFTLQSASIAGPDAVARQIPPVAAWDRSHTRTRG